jgi:cephalosporin hydroxylase
MDDTQQFEQDGIEEIARMGSDAELTAEAYAWMNRANRHKYSYHFSWMGIPIIQFPQDIVAMQELLWRVRPDLVIETGIARGGSILFYASMMEMMGIDGKVVGIDIDIRAHNRKRIEAHPMFTRVEMIEASSVAEATAESVAKIAAPFKTVMVVLDSNHTHEHVAQELRLYAPLVTVGSYLIVFDTVVEFQDGALYPNRPWAVGNNPHTAVMEFLGQTDRFAIDKSLANKLQITVAPDGYLQCLK